MYVHTLYVPVMGLFCKRNVKVPSTTVQLCKISYINGICFRRSNFIGERLITSKNRIATTTKNYCNNRMNWSMRTDVDFKD